MPLRGLHVEPLQVRITLVVGIEDDRRPRLVGYELLYAQDIVLVMVGGIDIGDVELAVLQHDKDAVLVGELAEEQSVLLVVEPLDIRVEPHLPSAERGVSVALQRDAVDALLGQEITLCSTSLDEDAGKVTLHEDVLLLPVGVRVEGNLDQFSLAVGIGRKVTDPRSRCPQGDIILLVTGDGGYVEPFDIIRSGLSVPVDDIINRPFVILLEHLHVQDTLADEHLVGNADDLILAIPIEDDDIIEVGAVLYELSLLQPCTDETSLPVDVQLLVGIHHLGRHNRVEVLDFRATQMVLAVLLLQMREPLDRDTHHLAEVLVNLGYLRLDLLYQFVRLVLVELQNTLHPDFQQPEDVVPCYLTDKSLLVRLELGVDESHYLVETPCRLKLTFFINTVFDEDALQRVIEQLFLQFVLPDFQLHLQQCLGMLDRIAQHVGNREEAGLVVLDDTAVGRNVNLAVAKCVECINGFVRRNARGEVHLYLHFGCRIVVYAFSLYLPLVHRFKNRFDKRGGVLAERYLADNKCLVVQFLNLGAHLDRTAPLSVVISAGINRTARGEVGIQPKRFAFKIMYGRLAQLAHVVRKDF